MGTAIGILIGATQMAGGGFCLGLGYWAAGLITKRVDEKFIMYDRRKLRQLADEMNLQLPEKSK